MYPSLQGWQGSSASLISAQISVTFLWETHSDAGESPCETAGRCRKKSLRDHCREILQHCLLDPLPHPLPPRPLFGPLTACAPAPPHLLSFPLALSFSIPLSFTLGPGQLNRLVNDDRQTLRAIGRARQHWQRAYSDQHQAARHSEPRFLTG